MLYTDEQLEAVKLILEERWAAEEWRGERLGFDKIEPRLREVGVDRRCSLLFKLPSN